MVAGIVHSFSGFGILAACFIGGGLSGCGKPSERSDCSKLPSFQAAENHYLPSIVRLAVASPYLEAAVRDVFRHDVRLVQLSSPGACPGHFDIRPSQVEELKNCGLLVRFDFQQALEERYKLAKNGSQRIIVASVPGGLCVPESYLAACQRVASGLAAAGLAPNDELQARLRQIEDRLHALSEKMHTQIKAAGLTGLPVLASAHQADFCRWLGLRVVAEMSGPDASSLGDIEQTVKAALAAGVKLVIANEPEGRRAADTLAERLQSRVVVFANFPRTNEEQAFDRMLQENLESLLAATSPSTVQP